MIRSSSHGIVLYRSHPRALPYLYELSGRGCNTESPMLHCPAERGMTAKVIVAWGKCPLYLQKRTSLSAVVMSALCQKRTHALQQIGSGNSFGTSIKRCELSWTGPIERNVLARIRCPLKLEAERIDGTRHRLAPGYKLSGSGFRAGWVHELRIFSRQACRASQSLSPGLHFARDFCSPLSAVGRDLIGDPRTLRTPKLPTFREQCGDETHESPCASAENEGKHLSLTLVGAFVDKDAGGSLGPSRPQIPFPSSHTDKAQIVEIDIAVMTGPYVPEKDRLAEAVVWGLCEGARASDGAAAIVKPISRDVPVGNLSHEDLLAEESDCIEKVPASFDHLVGASKQRRRHFEAERLSSFHIDDQFEASWLLHWQFGGIIAAENTAG